MQNQKTKKVKCLNCNKFIEIQIPTKNQVSSKGYWDSAFVCEHCDELMFKQVWPNGTIRIKRLGTTK